MTRDLSAFEQNLVSAMTEQAHEVEPPRFDAPGIVDTERRRARRRIGLAAAACATAAGIAACVAGSPAGTGRTPPIVAVTGVSGAATPSAPVPTQTPGASPGTASAPATPTPTGAGRTTMNDDGPLPPGVKVSDWTTGPTSSPFRGSVPPLPRLGTMQMATTPTNGFYRIAFEFQGQVPGYSAKYVDKVVRDGSGAAVSMPGSAYLQLTFHSAEASNVGDLMRSLDKASEVQGMAITGNFEGVVTVTVGLAAKHGYYVETATRSATDHVIYLDIAA
jgi:hypothetical protein